MNKFNKVVTVCEAHNFFRRVEYPKLGREVLQLDSTGALLKENLRGEWFRGLVINRDVQVFVSSGDFATTFDHAKTMCSDTPPFGVAFVNHAKKKFDTTKVTDNDSGRVQFPDYFEDCDSLNCHIFVAPQQATHFFHQWQTQRRIWWRKFAAQPGRYFLTDMRTDNNCQNVDIMAKYPWGDQLIESLRMGFGSHPDLSGGQLQFKNGRKMQGMNYVASCISFSEVLLNAVCDAYDEPPFQDGVRQMMRFHRKLAPYKISFSTTTSGGATVLSELKDLSIYLCRQLRKDNVSSLLIPASYKNTLESQFAHYDQLGIPYNVILNEKTLKDGIAQLRSRDTTLKEQVHVTDLPGYVEKLFKNY